MNVKGIILSAGFIMGALFVMSLQYTSASQMPKTPEVVELDHIGDIYEKVIFNHAMHMDVATCATCHHHSPYAPPINPDCLPCHNDSLHVDTFICKDCHAINPGIASKIPPAEMKKIYHLYTAGLKRAFHQQCMGCHEEMDVPNECNDCHLKRGNT
jgi:hypothetical protein